jgi:hypothetical protein
MACNELPRDLDCGACRAGDTTSPCHVDCDLYASTIDALAPLFARGQVSEGAVILFDDWNCNRASPQYGQRKAWDVLVARHRIRYSDEGRYGMASRRFIVHAYAAQAVVAPATDRDEIAELQAALAASEQREVEQAEAIAAAAMEIAGWHARLANAERYGAERAVAMAAAEAEIGGLRSRLGQAAAQIAECTAGRDAATAEAADLREQIAAAARRRADLAADVASARATVDAWLGDDAVRPVDENPISMVPAQSDADGFCGCLWGPVDTAVGNAGDAAYRMLGASGAAILLHRTTERTGFVIAFQGRVIGDCDPRDLLIAVNNEAPSVRSDERDGEHFTITVHVAHERVIAAAGRLVIKITDLLRQSPDGAPSFGFSRSPPRARRSLPIWPPG